MRKVSEKGEEMEVVHISAELAPIAKVGGLADVLHGLSRELLAKGHHVEIILPKYDLLPLNLISNLEVVQKNMKSFYGGSSHVNTIWQGNVDSIPVTLIDSDHDKKVFNRGKIYGCLDDADRFAYFIQTALTEIFNRKTLPDVIHLHDWHAAIGAVLLKTHWAEKKIPSILTIHNLSYQGHCDQAVLARLNLSSEIQEQLQDPLYSQTYNLLKGGILYADRITTVSPNYCREILTTDLGGPLRPTLQSVRHKFLGILNGIDWTYWNPATDPLLPFHYQLDALLPHPPFFKQKEKIKHIIRSRFGLKEQQGPLVGAITRLVSQKGPEFLKAAIARTLEWGGQFILLGSALDEKTHSHFAMLKKMLEGCKHVHLELSFDEELSHLVFATSDLFLVPSLFEPCGLTQLIAMRYGAVPLVRHTGGLADTVIDEKNGFVFKEPTIESFFESFDRALSCWRDFPKKWHDLIKKGMSDDYSWNLPAKEYLSLYSKAALSSD